jgi:hypothetical protein
MSGRRRPARAALAKTETPHEGNDMCAQAGARAKAQNAEEAAASSAASCGISLSEENEEKYR